MTEQGFNQQNQEQTTNSNNDLGKTAGILSIVFGIVGVFGPGIIFFPLTLITASIALWKKNFLLGVIGIILAIIVFMDSPTILGLIALKSVYDSGKERIDKNNAIAHQIIVSSAKQESPLIEASPEIASDLKPAQKADPKTMEVITKWSQSTSGTGALETVESTSIPQIFSMASVQGSKNVLLSVKTASWKQLGTQIETGPVGYDSTAKKGTIKEIQSVMKIMYLNLALKMNFGNVSDTEKGKIVHTLDSLEGAINSLEKGVIPEQRIEARSYDSKSGMPTLSHFGIKDAGNGKVVIFGIN